MCDESVSPGELEKPKGKKKKISVENINIDAYVHLVNSECPSNPRIQIISDYKCKISR